MNKEMGIQEGCRAYNYVTLGECMANVLELCVLESPKNIDILARIQIQANYTEKENSIK